MRLVVNSVQWNLTDEANAVEKRILSDFHRIFEMDGQLVSNGRLCNTIRLSVDNRHYYIKRYRTQGKRLWKGFGRSRPVVEYRNLSYFAKLGIPVPRIVGYGGQRMLGLFLRGAIVTEEIPQSVDLQTLLHARPDLTQNRPWLFRALRLTANYVRRIHDTGFTHGDLKCRNILVTTTEAPRVFLIDCPTGSRKLPFRWRRFVLKDLATLDRLAALFLSRATRLRFFLWYRNHTRLTKEDKALIGRITTSGRYYDIEVIRPWLGKLPFPTTTAT
jgi:tRNA A-37 threonylcarbamoyl transferase component Bud32